MHGRASTLEQRRATSITMLTMSASHRALFLVEIQDRIFEELLELGGRSTLAALARTCRAFHETAINLLWFRLENIVPLIRCIPAVRTLDLRHIQQETGKRWAFGLFLDRPMSDTDWKIFFKCADRVRVLAAEPHDFCISDTIFWLLCAFPERRALLPRLKSLQWRRDITESVNLSILFLRTLVTPTLTDIQFTLGRNSKPLENALHIIASTCPSLKSFHAVYDVDESKSPEHQVVVSSHDLESVTSGLPTQSVLRHLARLPNLRVMNVGHFSKDFCTEWIANNSNGSTPPFPRLSHLSFAKSHCDSVVKFLEALRLSLQSFGCIFHHPNDVESICKAVVESTRSDTLKTITLSCTEKGGLQLESIAPLYKFGNVTECSINFRNLDASLLNDNTLSVLAKSWPLLEKLHLNWGGWEGTTGITHKGLIELFTRCLHIEELIISVDFSGVDEETTLEVSHGRIVGSNCMFAAFLRSGSMDSEPPSLVTLLKALLPNLRRLIRPADVAGQTFAPTAMNRKWSQQEKIWSGGELPASVPSGGDDGGSSNGSMHSNSFLAQN